MSGEATTQDPQDTTTDAWIAYTQGAADAFNGAGLYYSGPHTPDYLKGAASVPEAARGTGPLARKRSAGG